MRRVDHPRSAKSDLEWLLKPSLRWPSVDPRERATGRHRCRIDTRRVSIPHTMRPIHYVECDLSATPHRLDCFGYRSFRRRWQKFRLVPQVTPGRATDAPPRFSGVHHSPRRGFELGRLRQTRRSPSLCRQPVLVGGRRRLHRRKHHAGNIYDLQHHPWGRPTTACRHSRIRRRPPHHTMV